MKQQKKKKKLISWILLLAWMAFIFYMSSCNGNVSSDQSGSIAYILHNILGGNLWRIKWARKLI